MERKYIIPLRREWLKAPNYSRTPRAVKAVFDFVRKHMKTKDVRIGRNLNVLLWKRGVRSPPHKVEVNVKKFDTKEGSYVRVELVGKEFEEEIKKKVEKKGFGAKLKQMAGQKEAGEPAKESLEEEKKEILKEDRSKEDLLEKAEKFADKTDKPALREFSLQQKDNKKSREKK